MDKKLFQIEKAHKLAGLIIDYHISVSNGGWFKAVLLNVQIEQIKAATYITKEKANG